LRHKLMSLNATPSETAEQPGRRSPFRERTWLLTLLLIALVFVAYTRVFNAGFIWDDESHLTQNPCIVAPLGLKEVWTTTRAVYYPLVLTTFWTVHKFVGLSPWPYHLLNVLLHAGSAVLLWQVLRQLNVRGAWLGAALWALHPVMVQSVAWVTELKNTQSCFFYLLSIVYFSKWDAVNSASVASPFPSQGRGQGEGFDVKSETPITNLLTSVLSSLRTGEADRSAANMELKSRRRVRCWNLSLSLVFFILATLSKPSVVMLPVVLALCVWWRRGRIHRRHVAALAPFVLISALASVWTILEQKFHAGAIGAEWAQTWLERLIIAGRAIWFYLGKLICPNPLIFIYPRWKIDSSQLIAYFPLVAALAGLVVLWLIRAKWSRAVFFAAAYYVVSLFPVLGFFSVYFFRYSFVSDHFQYLASMGPLALASAGIVMGCSRLAASRGLSALPSTSRQSALVTTPLVWISVVFLLLLVFLTWQQTAVYRDLITLYTVTLTKNPGCWMAHYNLGIALSGQGDTDGAIAHYRQAIELRPSYAEAHYNLGRLLAQKGQLDDAVAHYHKALELNPADAEAHNNLGATLFASGHADEAITHYRKALEIQPDYADASCNLANALLSNGDLDGAIAQYSACLRVSPNQVEAQYNLASALFRTGRTDEAIAHFQKVVELGPENADVRANLGSAFLAKGRVQDAIAQYRDALRIAPDNVAAQSNLAWLLATAADPSLRNGAEAVLLAERAKSESSRSENRAIVLRILAAAYAETGRFAEAKENAQQALRAAEVQGNSSLSQALRDEIALYDLGLPYHKEPR
jgi:protein O-mannosyl-transferase